ncbi:MAG TPA: hypothetical protein VFH68_15875 [Polyangia bacterium]|jgi:hypothetical protein|nr:hypothetical protein [Polyangia bacterium]
MKRLVSRALFLSLLPLAVASQGCSTYSYFDIDMKLGVDFNIVAIGRINSCHMFVTGAATDDFTLSYSACHTIDTAARDIGKIQYSTLADSGNLTFTLVLFERMESEACKLGTGAVTLGIDSGKTVAGTLTVPTLEAGCPQ